MAGDPWEDTTDCGFTVTSTVYDTNNGPTTTVYNDTTTGSWRKVTVTWRKRSTCTQNVSYAQSVQVEDDEEKRKELLHLEVIKNMKLTWNENKKEFKPVPKLRPSGQLRGVCFSGRGWA